MFLYSLTVDGTTSSLAFVSFTQPPATINCMNSSLSKGSRQIGLAEEMELDPGATHRIVERAIVQLLSDLGVAEPVVEEPKYPKKFKLLIWSPSILCGR